MSNRRQKRLTLQQENIKLKLYAKDLEQRLKNVNSAAGKIVQQHLATRSLLGAWRNMAANGQNPLPEIIKEVPDWWEDEPERGILTKEENG